MDPMMGMVFMIPWKWAPLNYQLCQGQTVSINQYQALYSLMGFTFGGDQVNNFLLPNLQGRVPVGTGQQPTGSMYTLAAHGGSEGQLLGINNMPVHTHAATFIGTSGSSAATPVTVPAVASSLGVTAKLRLASTATGTAAPTAGTSNYIGATTAKVGLNPATFVGPFSGADPGTTATAPVDTTITGSPGNPQITFTVPGGSFLTGGSVVNGAAGGSQPFSVVQPYLAMSFIIAVQGLYPDRP